MKLSITLASLFIVSASAFVGQQKVVMHTQTRLQNDLWGQPPDKEGEEKEMSKALPFIPRPKILDGTLAGDVGFE